MIPPIYLTKQRHFVFFSIQNDAVLISIDELFPPIPPIYRRAFNPYEYCC